MRQTHVAGEKLFVDFAGDTVPVIDPVTGEERRAHVFVAVLGASNYTYAEARWSEAWPTGSAPTSMRSPSSAACRSCRLRQPEGRGHRRLPLRARHQSDLPGSRHPLRQRDPADPAGKPRDKAKVEVGVLMVERFILARLRNRRFFSLAELNAAIREILGELNTRLMRKLGASRRELLRDHRPAGAAAAAGRTLPVCRVEEVPGRTRLPRRAARALLLGPIAADPPGGRSTHHRGHRRDVPSGQAGRGPSALAVRNRHTTVPEHMPSAHRRYAEWTPARMVRMPAEIGPASTALVETIMCAKPHPEQGFRACLGILRLARSYGSCGSRPPASVAVDRRHAPTARSPRS